MNLHNLGKSISSVIIKRGQDYLLSGHVESVRELKPGLYRAKVAGTELYEVVVQLSEQDQVLSSSCTCPFDMDAVCKHQAAVLMYLRDHMAEDAIPDAIESAPAVSLQQMLEAKDKSELVSLLVALALDSEQTEQRIRIYFSGAENSTELEDYRRLIRSYIDQYTGRDGFVDWGKVDRAVQGAELAAAKAVQAFEDNEPLQAVRINLCIFEEMLELLQASDDSDGIVSGMIEDSLNRIYEIVQLGEQLSSTEVESLFDLLMDMVQHPEIDGWSDWQLVLLRCSGELAVSSRQGAEWEALADQLSKGKASDSWSAQYFTAQLGDIRLKRLQKHAGEQESQAYLHNHLHFESFREQAITQAMDAARYDEAIRLAQEGEAQDTKNRLPGLVHKWERLRYEAYRVSGDTQSQRVLGLELLCDGELSYYPAVKSAYSAAEWLPIYNVILDRLEQEHSSWDNVYTKLLIQEKEFDRLLCYVQKHPHEVEKYYPHLIPDYLQEVIGIFRTYIERSADQASARKQYQQVCRTIQKLRKIAGSAVAEPIVHSLLAAYPKRSAFKDELTKLLKSL